MLLAELQHRTRNLLAVVQSVASQTLRKARRSRRSAPSSRSRLRALSRVQALLARADQRGVDLRELVEANSRRTARRARHGKVGRAARRSLPASVGSGAGAGAARTGDQRGQVRRAGAARGPAARDLAARATGGARSSEWRESGVDDAARSGPPRRKGYGTELIERALPYQLGARPSLEFGPDGVHCPIAVRIEARTDEDGSDGTAPLRGRRLLVVEDEYLIAVDLAAPSRTWAPR